MIRVTLTAVLLAVGASSTAFAASGLRLGPPPGEDLKAVGADQVASIEASSGDRVERMADGRLGSAWVSEAQDAGEASVTLRFETTRYLTRVDMMPGHGRDNPTFQKHARPVRVTLSWSGGEETFELRDRRRIQTMELAGLARTDHVTVSVEKTAGPTARGLAIAEVTAYEPKDVLSVDAKLRERIREDVGKLGGSADGEELRARIVGHGRPVVPWLVDRARHAETSGAVAALSTLMRLDEERGRALQSKLLREGAIDRAAVALRVYRDREMDGMADALHEAHQRLDGEVGTMALQALASTGDERAVEALVRALGSADPARMSVASAELPRYDGRGLEAAARLAQAETESVRLAAIASLARFDDQDRAAEALEPLTDHEADRTRKAAVRALGRLDSQTARAALGRIVTGSSPVDEDTALSALVRHGADAAPLLRELVEGASNARARRVFRHVAETDDEGVREMLAEWTTERPRPSWYRHAADALADQGEAGVETLVHHLRNNPDLADNADDLLERLAEHATGVAARTLGELSPARKYDDLRVALLGGIAEAGDTEAAQSVVTLYGEHTTSNRVRRAAVEAMGALSTPEVKKTVMEAIDHRKPDIATAALRSVAELGIDAAGPELLERLRGKHPRRWSPEAVHALGALDVEDAVSLFEAKFRAAPRHVKLAILRSAQRMDAPGSLQLLVDASASGDGAVSRTAQNLLRD